VKPTSAAEMVRERMAEQMADQGGWCRWECWQGCGFSIWPAAALADYLRSTSFEGALGDEPTACELRAVLVLALAGMTVVPTSQSDHHGRMQ
jgi:hypothetical protein